MGRLIIDGNSVFEIDEECLKRRKPAENCDIDKYMNEGKHVGNQGKENQRNHKNSNK